MSTITIVQFKFLVQEMDTCTLIRSFSTLQSFPLVEITQVCQLPLYFDNPDNPFVYVTNPDQYTTYTWSSGAVGVNVTVNITANYFVTANTGGCIANSTSLFILAIPSSTSTPSSSSTTTSNPTSSTSSPAESSSGPNLSPRNAGKSSRGNNQIFT